jgi:hypothetical protein
MCSGHYIALHRSACRGATSKAGEEAGPPSPRGFLIEASANIVVKAESVGMSDLGQGTAPPFIGQGRGSLQACRTVLATCDGVADSATEWTTVLANLASGGASWRALCPSRGGFEGGGVKISH